MGAVSRTTKKEIRAFEMKHFTILLILTVLLSGCARKTPTETIIDNHIEHIDQVLDYAKNNIEQTTGVMLLEGELKSCQIALKDVRASHGLEIDSLNTKVNYWRAVAVALFFACVGAILALIRRWFR